MALEIIALESREAAALTAAHFAARALQADLNASGRAGLFVSGGSTPRDLFEVLSGVSLDWSRVTVGLVDERWVPPDHPESNERLVRTHLLKDAAGSAGFLPMWTFADDHEAAAWERDGAYAPHCDAASFVLLGMGNDAHVASWFPGSEALYNIVSPEGKRCVLAAEAEGAETPKRLTLTGPVIYRAKQAVLLVFGAEKRAVLDAAMDSDPMNCPVRFAIDGLGNRLSIVWAP